MPTCPICGATYSSARCDNCDIDAVDDPNDRPDPAWLEVYVGPPQWLALVRQSLEGAGIPTSVPGEHSALSIAYLGPAAAAQVLVRAPDVERASAVLEELRSSVPEAFPEGTV